MGGGGDGNGDGNAFGDGRGRGNSVTENKRENEGIRIQTCPAILALSGDELFRNSQVLPALGLFSIMYSTQSFGIGLNLPPTSFACSDSNRGVQMVFSQGSADSQKVQQMLQQRVKNDLVDVDCRPSVCTVSHSDAAMELVESDLPENLQASVGLMRYHSAPGSFLASLAEDGEDIVPQVSSPEADNELARFFSSDSSPTSESNSRVLQQTDPSQSIKTDPEQHLEKHKEYSRIISQNSSHLKRSAGNIAGEHPSKLNRFPAILENGLEVSHNSFCSSQVSMICQAQGSQSGRQLMDNSFTQNPVPYNPLDSSGERPGRLSPSAMKNTLVRHSSSPAGVLSQMATDMQGYPMGVMKGNMAIGNIVAENGSCGNMVVPNRLCHQVNFLRQSSSPASLLAQRSTSMDIPEIVGKLNMHMGHSSGEGLAKGNSDSASIMSGGQGYTSSLSVGSWEDEIMLPGNYEGLQNGTNFAARKRLRDLDEKTISGLHLPDQLKGEVGSRVASALTNHQFNLYKSTASDIAIEKLLEDSVPCRIRAKRGCATHPRSIAERVRRTRISDRMRKLQELVPNMDRQTNTADMLDEAVEYVKFLQKQVQELSENRAKCDCCSRHESDVNGKN